VTINYIIATYSGINLNENKEKALSKQLWNVYEILKKKLINKLPCYISQITIICPTPREEFYPKYYNRKLWEYIFNIEFRHVKLSFQQYYGPNIDHSYDQWIQGYMENKNYDYNLLIEDDYYISPINLMFDLELIELYRKKFPNNIGYMCTHSMENEYIKYHASISNGIISSETFNLFKNPLKSYYDITDVCSFSQLKFSALFLNSGIDILDMNSEYKSIFWNSTDKIIIDYSSTTLNIPYMFLPVQCLPEKETCNVVFYENFYREHCDNDAIFNLACFNEIYSMNNSIIITDNYIFKDFFECYSNIDDLYKKYRKDEIYICDKQIHPICLALSKINNDLREELNLPVNSIVYGNIGNITIEFVKEVIINIVETKENIYFLLMNSEKFYTHPKIIHFENSTDSYNKTLFINTCDYMLHADIKGNKFGSGISDFSSLEKPIITWKHEGNKNFCEEIEHIKILKDTGIYYSNKKSLINIINNNNCIKPINYSNIYTPWVVMDSLYIFLMEKA